ncbi:MAG: L,D-transpeptidase family protein [Bacteroidales bacterium]|nr:L,D-transpeptidase family protein [Bacteroidales bacterium]
MGKRGRIIRRLFLTMILLAIIGGIGFTFLVAFSTKPPMEAIQQAQSGLSYAREVEAEKYAPRMMVSAERSWQLAMNEWKYQNERLIFVRNYEKLKTLAGTTNEQASLASEKALHIKDSLQSGLSNKLKTVGHKIDHFQVNYAHLPLNGTARQNYSNARLRYLESKQAYERGDYKQVGLNLDVASQLITKSVSEAHGFLSGYFKDLPKWRRWADETIAWSKNKKAAVIIVDKFAHRCYVYHGGKLKREFDAELGPNWIGTKLYRGDKATPEGKYHVTKKKARRETKYYKALLINYPNDDDKTRYDTNVKNGTIAKRGIGNLIEIHGDGGKGINWTDGCVALTNDDMDKLYEMVSVGTPVTIVGSLRSLKELNGF